MESWGDELEWASLSAGTGNGVPPATLPLRLLVAGFVSEAEVELPEGLVEVGQRAPASLGAADKIKRPARAP